jgi:subtilisin family serine protease
MRILIMTLFYPCLVFADVKIAVIDSGLSNLDGVKLCCPVKDLTKTGTQSDFEHHGDNVTHIISDSLKNYCVYHIKAWGDLKSVNLADAIFEAIRANVDIINISGGGAGINKLEKAAIDQALSRHIIVIAAAGNDGKSLDKDCYYYPACYPGVTAV